MITTFNQFCIFLAIEIVIFLLGWFFCKQYFTKIKSERSKELYRIAKELFDEGQYEYALTILGEAIGNRQHAHIYNLMGHVYEKLGIYSLEANSFFKARRVIFDKSFIKSEIYDQDMTFYFYRESLAYVKSENWEFAYKRSDDAIKMIRSNNLHSFVDDKNIEYELIAIRMISSLNYFTGKQAFDNCKIDALWLQENASDQLLHDLSKNLLELSINIDNKIYDLLIERSFRKFWEN